MGMRRIAVKRTNLMWLYFKIYGKRAIVTVKLNIGPTSGNVGLLVRTVEEIICDRSEPNFF